MTECQENLGDNVKKVLANFVSRVERLEEEKQEVAGQIKDVYAEAKSQGFDTKTLRTVIRRNRLDAQERAEQDSLLEIYEAALRSAEGLV
jgi:uncharacterized protein (UPF0335 family)